MYFVKLTFCKYKQKHVVELQIQLLKRVSLLRHYQKLFSLKDIPR